MAAIETLLAPTIFIGPVKIRALARVLPSACHAESRPPLRRAQPRRRVPGALHRARARRAEPDGWRSTGGGRPRPRGLHPLHARTAPLDEVLHLDAYLSRMLPNMYTRCSRRCGGTCGIPPNEYQLQRSGTHAGGMAGTGCLPARTTHPSVRFCAVRAFTTVGTAETLRGEPQAIRAQDRRRKRSA